MDTSTNSSPYRRDNSDLQLDGTGYCECSDPICLLTCNVAWIIIIHSSFVGQRRTGPRLSLGSPKAFFPIPSPDGVLVPCHCCLNLGTCSAAAAAISVELSWQKCVSMNFFFYCYTYNVIKAISHLSICYIHFARVKGVLIMTRMKKKKKKLTGSKTSTVPIIYGNNYNKN